MIRIRPEVFADRDGSLEVEREAFGEPEEAAIVEVVRDLDGSFALVADDDGAIVGHVQMSRAWIGVEPVLSLGPIGVLPDRQGEGIGSSLVREALRAARERGETAVILLGSQAFYPRFGFRPGSTFGLRNPYAGMQEAGFVVQEDDFMVAPLGEGGGSFSGRVRWHPAFGDPVEGEADPR
jgi:predicted N-acetyltransferase YhbS